MYRVCDICGGVDEDPRHSFAGVINDVWEVNQSLRPTVTKNVEALYDAGSVSFDEGASIVAMFDDTTSSDRHIDCCAANACPLNGTPAGCDVRAAKADGGTGEAMREAAAAVRAENPDFYTEG
jgi:NADH:ubiquinone oxidoreductase subunit E